jgi:hypothetical protein
MTVREGSDAEFNSMLRNEPPELQPDPRVDRVFTLMRGEPQTAEVVTLTQPKTEEERVAEYKAALRTHAEKLCEVMTAARRDGLILSWQAGWDVAGRAFVQSVDAMKPL